METGHNNMIEYIKESLSSFPAGVVTDALRKAFEAHRTDLSDIEASFSAYVESRSPSVNPYFFHSWSMTNHSAAAVSAMGNKMSMLLGTPDGKVRDVAALQRALVSLHRISDEDLGATGGTVHQELFYEMAMAFCGSDDWQSRRYALDSAKEFKEYRNRVVVKNRDQLEALLATAVHEVYTHAEVEYILPLFQAAVAKDGLAPREATRAVAWIRVHCGGVEHNHFSHALDAITSYAEAIGADLGSYDLDTLFGDYITRKADVMRSLAELQPAEALAA